MEDPDVAVRSADVDLDRDVWEMMRIGGRVDDLPKVTVAP